MSDLPRKTVARTARLASLPLGYAGRATLGLGRRIGGAPAEAVASSVQQRTAEQLFRVLGELKGGAMKFGQAMSIFESALPEALVAPYRATLTQLQDAAPPMPASVVHQVLARELGPSWRKQFESFDDDPAAAASIGQVHRAIWADGREVAVKIQYPGAGEALLSDLRQIGRAARLFGSWIPGIDIKPLVEELQARVARGARLRPRGRRAAAVRRRLRRRPRDRRTRTSWTTPSACWCRSGSSPNDRWPGSSPRAPRRNATATARSTSASCSPVRRGPGLLHADPHPGNFRLMPDGRVGVVDYGAVARLPEGQLPGDIGVLLRYAANDDYAAVLAGLRKLGFVKPVVSIEVDDLRAYLTPFVEPATTETFQFSREWMRGQFARINDPRAPGYTTVLKINLPPEYLLIHRVWLGGIGVLSQLGAKAAFAAILAESLPGFADDEAEIA